MAHVFFASMLLQHKGEFRISVRNGLFNDYWGEWSEGSDSYYSTGGKTRVYGPKVKLGWTRKVQPVTKNQDVPKGEASVAGGESWTQFHSNIKYNLSFVDSILTTENNLDLGLFLAFNIL